MASAAKLARKQRPELDNPSPHRFVGDVQPALGEQILDIPEAKREAKIEPHGMSDDCRGELVASKRDGCHSPPAILQNLQHTTRDSYTRCRSPRRAHQLRICLQAMICLSGSTAPCPTIPTYGMLPKGNHSVARSRHLHLEREGIGLRGSRSHHVGRIASSVSSQLGRNFLSRFR
jgi:hypothetical protein